MHEEENDAQKNQETDNEQREYLEVFDVWQETNLPAAPSASFRELIELKTKLEMTEFQYQDAAHKLESANYQIGYLQARLEASQEQLKLLTDSRRMQPWWQRWRQWFVDSATE